jgi:hypothetical protein
MNKYLLLLLFCILFVPSVNAETLASVAPNPLNFVASDSFSKTVNVTVTSDFSGVLHLYLNTPFIESHVDPSIITFSNGTNTYYPILYFTVTKNFPAGNYSGWFGYATAGLDLKADINIIIPETVDFNVSYPKKVDVVDGQEGDFLINITNYGNRDLNFSPSANATILQEAPSAITVYRQGYERIKWRFKVPNNLAPADYTEQLSLDSNHSYTITFSVKDSTAPVIVPEPLPDIKVNEPFVFRIQAFDNIKVERVSMDIICSGVAPRHYDFGKIYETIWFIGVEAIPKPAGCIANIYAFDASSNQNLTQVLFSVDYAYGVDIKNTLVVQKFKTDYLKKVNIMTSNETINVSIKLVSLTYPNVTNATMYFAMGADNANIFKKFENIGDEVILEGKEFNINFKSFVIGDFSGRIEVTVPDYIMQSNKKTIDFTGTVGLYSVAEPYHGNAFGIDLECQPNDLGTFESSYNSCKFKMPIDIDPRDISLPVSLKQLGLTEENYEYRLNQTVTPLRIQIAGLWSWLMSIIVFFCIVLLVVWIQLKPTIFYIPY